MESTNSGAGSAIEGEVRVRVAEPPLLFLHVNTSYELTLRVDSPSLPPAEPHLRRTTPQKRSKLIRLPRRTPRLRVRI